MPDKTDDPTGVNWNGAATNEYERVEIVYSKKGISL